MKFLSFLWPDLRNWLKSLLYPLFFILIFGACSSNTKVHKMQSSLTPTKESKMFMADRVAPAEIEPIELNGVRYSQTTQPGDLESGYLEAKEIATDKVLWTKRVYEPSYSDDLERDVQEAYFSAMKLSDDQKFLVIKNENNEIWRVELDTGNSHLVSRPDESLEFDSGSESTGEE